MSISNIKGASEACGITAIISNSTEKIETQLNKITGVEELPIMLVSWDLEGQLEFDENGFLKNPSIGVVVLLMTKAENRIKEEYEEAAEEMALLYQKFLFSLNSLLVKYNKENGPSVTNINYTLAPMYGMGKHSGILGRFTMIDQIVNC